MADPINPWTIRELCDMCGVSTSGYYRWSNVTKANIEMRNIEDQEDFELILEAYNYLGYSKGHRQIHMHLLQAGIQMNRKKIQRLMKKFNLVSPIRKRKWKRKASEEYLESAIKKDLVKRKFKAYGPRKILLTDITYLPYGRQKWAYLATVKDAYTNEILTYNISNSLKVDIVLTMMKSLDNDHGMDLAEDTVIHSDQGSQYTSVSFQDLVKQVGLLQSMSRRGNCWDNAPQESFYGHMKDVIELDTCDSLEDVKELIAAYMDYYNNERYQWNLEKLSPTQFYQFYLTGVYPLAHFYDTPELPEVRTIEIDE